MENPIYATLSRQSGLLSEMRTVANNIANISTTGFKSEGMIFAEHIRGTGPEAPSLSMAHGSVRNTATRQGTLSQTGGSFDLAIEGDGFFLIETPQGERLTRAGHFLPNEQGDLVTPEGHRVLDPGGAPVFVPQGVGPVGVAADGTISAEGRAIGQIGVVVPTDALSLRREGGTRFVSDAGWEPSQGRVLQGYLEESNVDPVLEISRMIEVQRAYEMGQKFLDREDSRIRNTIKSLVK